ncbi:hypothetical protein [Streptomyces rapamycinicus]|uniref:hypothetical protein n=1 Tax=Streptomyces rapamycinicus TaxID=1226757 RepID=UPI003D7C207A
MTACAFDTALTGGVGDRPRGGFTIASDHSYGARLALSGEAGCWYPERWTLDGPEPYAVPLPAAQPEEPDSELLPLADGQVLIHRRVAGHHAFSLLYPTGPGTGERPLGSIDRAEVSLLPPAPGGLCAFALGRGPRSTSVWLLFGGGVLAPQHLAEVPGRCTGGSWLDRTGRLLALDRELDGRTKTVVVDLRRGGEISPLLQITERSDDRLLLADPDSGLLLVRSDAPGEQRLGWGVLGSTRPVRFPDCLRPAGWSEATPFAVQPGQVLTPEVCAVAFRIDGRGGSGAGAGAGAGRPWVGVWRPAERRLREFPAPEGWLRRGPVDEGRRTVPAVRHPPGALRAGEGAPTRGGGVVRVGGGAVETRRPDGIVAAGRHGGALETGRHGRAVAAGRRHGSAADGAHDTGDRAIRPGGGGVRRGHGPGAVAAGRRGGAVGSDEAAGARRIAGATRASGAVPAEAPVVQASRTATPAPGSRPGSHRGPGSAGPARPPRAGVRAGARADADAVPATRADAAAGAGTDGRTPARADARTRTGAAARTPAGADGRARADAAARARAGAGARVRVRGRAVGWDRVVGRGRAGDGARAGARSRDRSDPRPAARTAAAGAARAATPAPATPLGPGSPDWLDSGRGCAFLRSVRVRDAPGDAHGTLCDIVVSPFRTVQAI